MPFICDWHKALRLQHFAAQLIALAGTHLIPQKPNNSNTNMQYLP